MGYIDRELSRIEAALHASSEGEPEYAALHVAQQALKWATEPQGFAAPLDVILHHQPLSPTGTPAATADCLAADHLVPS